MHIEASTDGCLTCPAGPAERRRQPDRRQRSPLLTEVRWLLRGRRRTLRRSDEAPHVQVDWYDAKLLLFTTLVFTLSALDAALTLMLLRSGLAVEANPFMVELVGADPHLFVTVKSVMTGCGLITLVAFSRLRLFGHLALTTALEGLLLFYLLLVTYEFALLGAF